MKIFSVAVATLTLAFSVGANSSTINFGNTDDFGLNGTFLDSHLLGETIYISQEVDLLEAGIIFYAGGYNANVGIYTDFAGSPDQLIATTGSFYVSGAGTVETAFLTNPTVPAGNYWFMAVYDSTAHIGLSTSGGAVSYSLFDFSSELPTSFGATQNYDGQDFNYYLKTSTVPLPAAAWLFMSALGGLVVAKHKKAQR